MLRRALSSTRAASSVASASTEGQSATERIFAREHRYGSHNYRPVPVVLSKGEGVFVWDVEGKRYFDMLSAYSAVNQGHCHPRLVKAMQDQAAKLTLTSRAFYNDTLHEFEEKVTTLIGYDKVLPMNTGVEAVETGLKLARRWAYDVKGVPDDKAKVVFAKGNFHGRTMAAVSASTDPKSFARFGPLLPGIEKVEYNNLQALEASISDPHTAAFIVEPIQGEAGVIVPDDGYLKGVSELCKKYNVLFVCDEVQTGLGRTGKLMCHHYEEGVRPDMVLMGKALSGGMYPVSAVLGDDAVMLTIAHGEHCSTYGGNPMGARMAVTALDILVEERLSENSAAMGEVLLGRLRELPKEVVSAVRGRGLFTAIVIGPKFDAWDVSVRLKERGVLARNTQNDKIRFSPPLCITKEQLEEACDIIHDTLKEFADGKHK